MSDAGRATTVAWAAVMVLLLVILPAPLAPAADTGGAATLLLVTRASADPTTLGRELVRDYALTIRNDWPLAALEAHCFELHGDASDEDALIARLRRDPRVTEVQRNQRHRVAAMPVKDPYFDLQSRTRYGGVASILRKGSGRNIRIAVIDTGVAVNHPDLAGQISAAVNFVGGASDSVPAEFHGTAVAGLISARPGNRIGIHGLAPDAEMLALRACWEPAYGYGLCNTNTLAQALDYAIDVRARIINLSLAGPEDPLLSRLVNRAIELGAVVFGAIGEEASQSFPASIAGVIAVEQGYSRNQPVAGARLTVPGRQLLTTVPGGRYDFVTGSSFATAHASGVAAVMLEQRPHLGANDLVEWLRRLHGNDQM